MPEHTTPQSSLRTRKRTTRHCWPHLTTRRHESSPSSRYALSEKGEPQRRGRRHAPEEAVRRRRRTATPDNPQPSPTMLAVEQTVTDLVARAFGGNGYSVPPGTPRMSGNALGIPGELGEPPPGRSAGLLFARYRWRGRWSRFANGHHNSAQTWRYLPLFGSGRGAFGLLFTATEAAPCAERYSHSRRSIASQTFSGSRPSDV